MAAKGDPSALHFVFAKPAFSTAWWDQVLENSDLFASRMHLNPFLRFADDPMERLCGRKCKKNIHRAALEEAHGYDTKYAMNVIRLYLEAKEYVQAGKITLPNPRVDLLVAIRNGQNEQSEIEATGKQFEAKQSKPKRRRRCPMQSIARRYPRSLHGSIEPFAMLRMN
jgi:hypothetical protein